MHQRIEGLPDHWPRLDRCPFCAGFGKLQVLQGYGVTWRAICGNPECPVEPVAKQGDTPAEAAALWNTRLTAAQKTIPSQGTGKEGA